MHSKRSLRIVARIAVPVLAVALMAGMALAQAPQSTPLGTAFTYQGQLKVSDAPYTGTCDIKFGLFDVSQGGTAIATLTKTNVAVDEGYLTVQLDYGSGRFAGDQRWLEMSVRCPSGSGSYQVLAPRQEVTASPYALHAATAPWSGLAGMPAGFADGTDNDTTYSAGTGLTLSGTTFSLNTGYTDAQYVNEGQANSVTSAMIVSGAVSASDMADGAALAEILDDDGAGSALDADLLDGSHAGDFAAAGHDHAGETWYGGTIGLTLYGGGIGLIVGGESSGLEAEGMVGVHGSTSWSSGWGVIGSNTNGDSMDGGGVWGTSASGGAIGLSGENTAGYGGTAVRGWAKATEGGAVGVSGYSDSTSGTGVYGQAAAVTGTTYGMYGVSNSTTGRGVYGVAYATSGSAYGVYGRSFSDSGTGVFGQAPSVSGTTYGVYGNSASTDGCGVFGDAYATSGSTYGVFGRSDSTDGRGVYGQATAGTGFTFGVFGQSDSTSGAGVYGLATNAGTTYGMYGVSHSTSGTGVYGGAFAGTGATYGVHGRSDSTSGTGVYGEATPTSGTTAGVLGKASSGVSWGVAGWNAANGAGVGAWSRDGDLIQAIDGDFPGGTLRFKVDQAGNVYADGTYNTFAQASPSGTEHVALYGLSGTEVWIEELGSGALVEGRAQVAIDPVYAQTAALAETYNVYLTATCQEPVLLFVSEKAPDHFTVQGVGLDGQPSACGFDYRLAARRLGYEGLRLEPVELSSPVEAGREAGR